MDPGIQRQFKHLDRWVRDAERRLLATANLGYKARISMLVDTQIRLDALTDSDARLYSRMELLTEKMTGLPEAQKKTDDALRRFIERSGNGHAS